MKPYVVPELFCVELRCEERIATGQCMVGCCEDSNGQIIYDSTVGS